MTEPFKLFDDSLSMVSPLEGSSAQFVTGGTVSVAKWALQEGAIIPRHDHVNEQIVNILSGTLWMRVGDDEYHLDPGESLVIPSGVRHEGRATTDVVCIDVFSPPRDDYASLMST